MAVVPLTGFQPKIPPSSVLKRNTALPPPTGKLAVGLKTTPVGVECVPGGLPAGGGMVTTSDCGWPVLPLYNVERPVPLSATQKGLIGPAARPQGFTRCGSAIVPGTV